MEWGAANVSLSVDGKPAVRYHKSEGDTLGKAPNGGDVERELSIGIARQDVCVVLEEQGNDLRLPVVCRGVEQRCT